VLLHGTSNFHSWSSQNGFFEAVSQDNPGDTANISIYLLIADFEAECFAASAATQAGLN
jgi:hypothetical protein